MVVEVEVGVVEPLNHIPLEKKRKTFADQMSELTLPMTTTSLLMPWLQTMAGEIYPKRQLHTLDFSRMRCARWKKTSCSDVHY
jgi:hypothetical protein